MTNQWDIQYDPEQDSLREDTLFMKLYESRLNLINNSCSESARDILENKGYLLKDKGHLLKDKGHLLKGKCQLLKYLRTKVIH